MAVTKTTPAKKASASTEIVLGQAAQQITKAVSELASATNTINKMVEQAEELTLQVANKEEAIISLDVAFAEKERQLKVDLDLSFRANTDRVVNEYLTSVGKTVIPASELSSLRKELDEVKSNTDGLIKKEVATVVSSLKSQYENEIKLIHSENKAIAAENAAKIGTLANQNEFLSEQVTKLYLQLDAERAAGIERAKAGSVGSINVSGQGK
jgi:hypothetical protein